MTKGLIVAAPRSGAGKTTITLALLAALRRRGLAVRAAKSGPDYIDPAFHRAATGEPCLNLDTWAMMPAQLEVVAGSLAVGAEAVVIESAMGLFDGVAGDLGRHGSAADLAARFGLPVLLVLDVSGQSQSAAAVARGFMLQDPAVRIAGVVLNRVASERHYAGVAAAIDALGLPVLGSVRRDPAISLAERHLGLVQVSEHAELPDLLRRLADVGERNFHLDAILDAMAPFPPLATRTFPALPPPGQRIALAQDVAFSFVYPHILGGWRAAGAEIVPFSPLADEGPADDGDVCWLPGGYPELHAAVLSHAGRFRTGVQRFAANKPVHGECGGHMVLGTTLTDAAGTVHPMLSLLGHATSFTARRLHLGYREATMLGDCALGRAGTVLRGHEFHYAMTNVPDDDGPLMQLADAQGHMLGPAGGRRGNVTGSFFHVIARVR
jgi:cobyrinic acid a,c-diamide synthase